MQKLFYDDTQSRSQDRIKLFGYPTVSEWNFSDDDLITDDSSQYSISDLQDYQKQMLEGWLELWKIKLQYIFFFRTRTRSK